MRKLYKLFLLLLLLVGVIVTSCQKEDQLVIDDPNDDSMGATSPLVNLLLRTAQNAGHIDDIIDGNSCASVAFPVVVIANGQKLVLESYEDVSLIREIFDQFPTDNDTLIIIFPITVILDDFTELEINNPAELQALIQACTQAGGSNAIDCLDFVYPFTFFVYNSNQELTSTETVNQDRELYEFLTNLDENDVISIDYGISVTNTYGEITEVNSNEELEQLISACLGGPNDPIDQTRFEDELTTDHWYITYFFDDFDETSNFSGFEFEFFADGTAYADGGGGYGVDGLWQFNPGSDPVLGLSFGNNAPFDELDENWDILEATNEKVRLKNVSSDGSTDYLTFERTSNPAGSNVDLNELLNQLTTGIWYLNLYDDDGVNETCDYSQYAFRYNTDGTAMAMSANDLIHGFWTVAQDNGSYELVFNFDVDGNNDPLEDLNDSWDIEDFNENLISLMDVSGGNGGTDLLVFGRSLSLGCGNDLALILRDNIREGNWYVSKYLDNGNNETIYFSGYVLTFNSNGTLVSTDGNNTFEGVWAPVMNGPSSKKLILDFEGGLPFEDLSDNWDVLFHSNLLVYLESSNGGGTDTLAIERL